MLTNNLIIEKLFCSSNSLNFPKILISVLMAVVSKYCAIFSPLLFHLSFFDVIYLSLSEMYVSRKMYIYEHEKLHFTISNLRSHDLAVRDRDLKRSSK